MMSTEIDTLGKALRSCHSQPLSMIEYAQNNSSNIISLAEHLGTRICDHIPETPNKLSEDIIKCMSYIYCKLVDPPLTNQGISSPTSSLSSMSAFSPKDHSDMMWSPGFRRDLLSFDVRLDNPFHVQGLKEFSGPYSTMVEIQCIYRDGEKMGDIEHKLQDFRCILLDENDNVLGHDTKYNCHLMENIEKDNLLHIAFSVFLFNSKYELLLQQRSGTKVTFPLVWTNTCCSHPLYRESELIPEDALGVRNAAQRKLLDELGIVAEDVPVDQFTTLGRILYKAPSDGKWGEHEVDYLLFIVRDVTVNSNPDEVADIKYLNQEELKELLRKADAGEEGIKLSPWFRLVVDNFLFKWWDHVQKGTLAEAIDMKTIHKLT